MTTAKTWDEYQFPDWVPESLRASIRDFWRVDWGRSPARWHTEAMADYNRHPPIGSRVEARSMTNSGLPLIYGRWVPLWNNIGSVVLDDGSTRSSSTCGLLVVAPAE